MRCPYCQFLEDKVLDSRVVRDGAAIKRRRECLQCGRRFTTYEHIEERRVQVVKKDGRREPFDRQKVLHGLQLACRKRPVSSDSLDRTADELERKLYDSGQTEVSSSVLGEMVVEALRQLDPVAYVRFASVYRDFQDLTQFHELLDVLRTDPTAKRGGTRRRLRKKGEVG